jgi:2-iminobutanoate/2-iminopropanoate deaminase|tara:strand:- start:10619 stop:10987 length:369 start_codon:yes stop_codon:yes gene_type:complete
MSREIIGDVGGKPYSPGTRSGNLVFVSGQLGLDSTGKLVSGGADAETRQCIENLKAVLAKTGATLDDVTMVNVYITDLDNEYGAMNEVYSEYFGDLPPARATVEISKLALGGTVEISAIAVL